MSRDITWKRGISWFMTAGHRQNKPAPEGTEQRRQETAQVLYATEEREEEQPEEKEQGETGTQAGNSLLSKDNQDKVVLDLIVSVENMIKDRQLIHCENTEMDEQLKAANETISRLKQDLLKQDQLIQGYNKEVRSLENRLTNKQMSYDQLLEDYKEYQNNSSLEYEKISNQMEAEINKYNKLKEESMNVQYQNMAAINKLQETIRNLEIENQQYIQQYKKIAEEKSNLMQTINDFTKRMSFSFPPKAESPDPSDTKETSPGEAAD